jgi:5-methylcytosine-specific restriction endonuclease McrA
MKFCNTCKIDKSRDEFSKCKAKPDGLQNKCKSCTKEYNSKNKKRQSQLARAWYIANQDIQKEKHAEYRSKTKEWRKAYDSSRYLDNKEYYYVKDHNRKAIIKGKTVDMPPNWRELVLEFYGERCLKCGKEKDIQMDHVIPISWDESIHTLSNIQPLCEGCNKSKGALNSDDFRDHHSGILS